MTSWMGIALCGWTFALIFLLIIIVLALELRKAMEANVQMQIRHLQHAKELHEVNTALTESIIRAADKPFIRPPRPSEVQETENWFSAKPTVHVAPVGKEGKR